MEKYHIVGAPGSGKSTLAEKIAQQQGIEHIELDSLFWGENWTMPDEEVFRERVEAALAGKEGWVIDGVYLSKLGEGFLDRSDIVIHMDTPMIRCLGRVAGRGVRRSLNKEVLWGDNVEKLSNLQELLRVIPKSHKKVSKQMEQYKQDDTRSAEFIRLKTNNEAQEFLESLKAR